MCAVHLAILDDTEEVVSGDHGCLGTLHEVHQLIRVDRRDLVLQYESIDRVNEGHQDTSQLVSGKVLDGLGVTLCPLRLAQPTKDESGSQELLLLGRDGETLTIVGRCVYVGYFDTSDVS